MFRFRLFFIALTAGLLAVSPAWAQRDLLVSSFFTDQVKRYHGTTGAYLGNFASGGTLALPTYMTYGPDGNLYVSSFGSSEVLRYNGVTGAPMGTFVTSGSGGLVEPMGLKFGP